MKYVTAPMSAALLLLCALAPASASAADNAGGKVYAINAENGSGQHGTVALKARGPKTVVEIHLLNAPTTLEPAHIRLGPCSHLSPTPKYALIPVVDGISETTVNAPISVLAAGNLAVNVHKSITDLKDYVACGDLSGRGHM